MKAYDLDWSCSNATKRSKRTAANLHDPLATEGRRQAMGRVGEIIKDKSAAKCGLVLVAGDSLPQANSREERIQRAMQQQGRVRRIPVAEAQHDAWQLAEELAASPDPSSMPVSEDREWLREEWYASHIELDGEGAKAIFQATTSQAASDLWFCERSVRLTASSAKRGLRRNPHHACLCPSPLEQGFKHLP